MTGSAKQPRLALAGGALAALALLCSSAPARSAESAGAPAPAVQTDPSSGVELLLIPGGEFTMGSMQGAKAEQPLLTMHVADFWLGRSEVTVGQFRRFVESTGYVTDAERSGSGFAIRQPGEWVPIESRNWKDPGFEQLDTHPVVHVSWNDAKAFAAWAGLRLPSEVEWEYAAGNGARHTEYPWGDVAGGARPTGNLGDLAAGSVYPGLEVFAEYDDGFVHTAPVCSFPPNDFGLCDMAGNVSEWVEEWFARYDVLGDSYPREYRICRGGGWESAPFATRVANRGGLAPQNCSDALGFRVARSATPPLSEPVVAP